jgi:hypothetical protein
MEVKVLKEEGFELACRGMAYSYKDRAEDVESWWEEKKERAFERITKLAHMDGGHNKALESITVWIDVEACRAWWSEMDTYRVGMTKNSESSMHTLSKREPTQHDFEEGTPEFLVNTFIDCWKLYKKDVTILKQCLPEGFLQRRLVCTNYKVLRNIVAQRRGHRLKWWDVFIDELLSQLQHPEFIEERKSNETL